MKSVHQQFLKQGHGKTAPWVDLVNSEEWDTFGARTEHLENPAWFPYFLKQWHFAVPQKAAPLSRLKDLRAALRHACEALAAGKAIPGPALRRLNSALNVPGKQQLFESQDGQGEAALRIAFVPAVQGWDWILAQTARSFADALADGGAERIKICRNDDCKWVFYDRTKGRTRCWCSDASCGNRDRVRRARERNEGAG
jgi:predicted RNA-binding Zn ribbon-like protein